MQPEILGTAGNDELTGTAGSDTIRGLDGDDVIEGGESFDVLVGGAGNDTIIGGPGFDLINGGDGNDNLLGSGWLTGDAGADILSSTGSALLMGGEGGDLMTGAAGFDRFRYDFIPGESDADDPDTIRFFQEGTDKIALNVGLSDTFFRDLDFIGNQTFDDWIDSVQLAGLEVESTRSGNVVARVEDNVLEIDNNFDGVADLTINFTQDVNLTGNDILLF